MNLVSKKAERILVHLICDHPLSTQRLSPARAVCGAAIDRNPPQPGSVLSSGYSAALALSMDSKSFWIASGDISEGR